MRVWTKGLTLALALLVPGLTAKAAGDATAGAERATACKACHGPDGISTGAAIPNLAGQKELYLANQLQAFRSGDRKNDLMAAISKQLTDADIANLAAFWSGQAPAGGDKTVPDALASLRASKLNTLPADFPKGFTVYSTIRDVQENSVELRYANKLALDAARSNKPLPDGSIIVRAFHKAKTGSDGKPLTGADGQLQPGEVTSYSAMARQAGWGDSVPALLRNENWHYNLFAADKTPRAGLNQAQCLACHQPLQADSYVFTIGEMRGSQ